MSYVRAWHCTCITRGMTPRIDTTLTGPELLRQAADLYECAADLWEAGADLDGDRLAELAREYHRAAFERGVAL